MFFKNDEYVASETALLEPKRYGDGTTVDKNVRAHVEHEFSLMEQEHARIRSEALTAHFEDQSDG